MSRRITGVAFLALLFGAVAFSKPCTSAFEKVFAEFFKSSGYEKRECQDNACRLLSKLEESGVSLAEAKVVYLMGILAPKQPRDIFAEWPYHVFVVYKGKVLDLDFGSKPNPMDLELYLRTQWIPNDFEHDERIKAHVAKTVQVIELPADEFQRTYPLGVGSSKAMQDFVNGTMKKIPVQNLSEYFEASKKTRIKDKDSNPSI